MRQRAARELDGDGRRVPLVDGEQPCLDALGVVLLLVDALREAIEQLPDFSKIKDRVDIEVTSEGLRIELIDTANDSFFQVGSAMLHSDSKQLLGVIASELGKIPNRITVEGHTDGRPFAGRDGYGNWELSADRANSARRAMQDSGLRPDQVDTVRGYADRRPRIADDPLDARNRRISIVVRNS